jgi:hypothetical protein
LADGTERDKKRSSQAWTAKTRRHRKRRLDGNATAVRSEDDIVPGRGWYVHGWTPQEGFCDGSAQSECGRSADSQCLLYGANDNHMDLQGDSLSGWLVFTIPNVREGIILARMEWWCGDKGGTAMSKGWTNVNDGKTYDTTPFNRSANSRLLFEESSRIHLERELGKPTINDLVPPDFKMDVAINGKITRTWSREEWVRYTQEYTKNCALWPLLDDESMAQRDWEGEPVEVAIRFRSESKPKQWYCISHVYYA